MKLLKFTLTVFFLQFGVSLQAQSCDESVDQFTGDRIVFSRMTVGMSAVMAITNNPSDTVLLYRSGQKTYIPDYSHPAIVLLGDNSRFEAEMTDRGTVIGPDGRGEWIGIKLTRQMLIAIGMKGIKGVRFSVPGGFEIAEVGGSDKTKKIAHCMLNK